MDNSTPFVIETIPGSPADRIGFAPRRIGSVFRRLRRLAQMPLPELAGRCQQEVCKRIDRLNASETFEWRRVIQEQNREFADPASVSLVLHERMPARFFAGASDASSIGAAFPEHRRQITNAAGELVQGRFSLLGYRGLWFGNPIDWHLDPVWARRSPREHWSRLDPLDAETVGDSKVVWELNRLQWLVQIAEAYAFTGQDRFAEACMSTIEQWLDANPPGIGVNWTSSLEVACRAMSWCWVLALIRGSRALSEETAARTVAALCVHARHIARYLSHYFSPNTHLTGEALGLFYIGVLWPELRDAQKWRTVAIRILLAENEKQICSDGVHFERSTCYQRYTADIYLHFLILAARNGIDVPSVVHDRVRGLVEFLVGIRQPDGSMPLIGDDDGGQLCRIVERGSSDVRGTLAVGAAVFESPTLAWASDGIAPEVQWLMGKEGAATFERLVAVAPSHHASRVFPHGGYVVMRSGWNDDAHQLVVDVGPLGCSYSAGHGHADLLSVQCTVFGEPCVVDAGTYCYTPEKAWRDFFRGTFAHNTLTIDGQVQSEPDGPFSWRHRPRVRLREWRINTECDFLDAEHVAYTARGTALVHRRRVIFVKPDWWVVIDDVTTDGSRDDLDVHAIDIAFQFTSLPVSKVSGVWVRADTLRGNALWIRSFGRGSAGPVTRRGELSPIRGWISPAYGQRQPAPMVVFSTRAQVPWRGITVLVPERGQQPIPPGLTAVVDDTHHPLGVILESRSRSVLVDDHEFLITAA
jgi:Heparinase II/III-like protein/Heparinase II/III N-terminus